MSEDFDKEAERKRLREKYEADQEDREATERMSELLLQGATMTNQHCDTCGSPIFRYQGREFCPTCQEERGQAQGAGEGQAEDEARAEGEAGSAPGREGQTSADAGQDADGAPAPDTGVASPAGQRGSTPGTGGQAGQPGGDASSGATAPGHHPAGAMGGGAGQSAPAGSLDEARQSLVETITSLTRRAAATEDPRQAKELLAAAREAAETLATLQGSR